MTLFFGSTALISESVVERLGWVLVHSLWQFALVALLTGALLRALRRRSAATRYHVLVGALALSLTAPVATWILQPDDALDRSAGQIDSTPAPVFDRFPLAGNSGVASDLETAVPTPVQPTAPAAPATPRASMPPGHDNIPGMPSWPERARTALRPWLGWLVAGWGFGIGIASLRPLLGWHMLWRLRYVGVSPASAEVLAALQRVSQRLGLRRAVQVMQSTLARVPVAIGYVRPMVLLPVSLVTSISAAQLDAILAHELAHVRRHDFVINLLQILVETIFFYHPAVWWLSRRLRLEREHCCDDLVVGLLGNRIDYGRALLAVAEHGGRNPILALGAADGSLLSRVRRIVGVAPQRADVAFLGRGPVALLGVTCLGAALAMSMNWNRTAQDDRATKDSPDAETIRARTADDVARENSAPKSSDDKNAGPGGESNPEDIFSRKVSLTANAMPLKNALAALARAAQIELQLDAAALKEVGLDVDKPVTATINDEPLGEALGTLIHWQKHLGALRTIRSGKLVVTTLQRYQAEIERYLPEWLKVHYNRGLLADLDDDHNVVSITAGEVMSDELLAKLKTLPKLRELHIESTKRITPAGLKRLAELSSLQKLSVFSLSHDGTRLGDTVIQSIAGLQSLHEFRLNQCGTTDAGFRLLETMSQLTLLDVDAEPRLTDAAIASIVKLKRLKHLGLNSYVGTEDGWMRFSTETLRSLVELRDLEHLHLVGQPVSAEALNFPRLRSLSLGTTSVDDTCAERIAACRRLQVLNLVYTKITDDGLKQIAGLPDLRRLSLDSRVVTDAGIKHLTRLEQLQHVSLRASQLTDAALRPLAGIKTLTRVDLHGSGEPGVNAGTCFTIAGVQQLKALPKLRTLWLTNVEASGDFLGLRELTQLRDLTLMMTNIRADELDALEAALPNTQIHAATGSNFSRVRNRK